MEEEEKERGITIIGGEKEATNKKVFLGQVGMACHGLVLGAALRSITEKEPNVIIVHEPEPPIETIEINGIKYAKIEKDKPNYGHSMRGSMSEVLIPTMYNYGNNYQRKLPKGIDIIKEFGLIQNKESKLSKWERNAVVRIFEKNFRAIIK